MSESASAPSAAIAAASEPIPAPRPEWNLATRIFFRLACVYWLLYSLPSTGRISFFGVIPGAQAYKSVWQSIGRWVAVHAFHLSGPVTVSRFTGSGDTTLDYIEELCFLVLTCAAVLAWSLADRNRKEYRTLHSWLRLLVRYTLAITLLSYGFSKVFPLQFPFPALSRMIEPFGDFSPMGVLWQFMGSSPAYTIFAGMMETLGGALLLFRRTTTLGALVSAGVLLNVVVLNFCYDVPVKLYSLNLLLMAVFLTAPDLGKLTGLLVLNRPAAPVTASGPVFEKRWMRIGALSIKILFIGFFPLQNALQSYQFYKSAVLNPTNRPPLYGLYQVESFKQNGKEIPPLMTDVSRWKAVVAQNATIIQVRMMDDTERGFATQYDASASTVTLTGISKIILTYSRPDADHLVLTGTVDNDPLEIRMRRKDPSEFLLVNRGFHWINELPFNR
jgi:uncharacterized membrane protein YphA (DoxX/SURF4 family)